MMSSWTVELAHSRTPPMGAKMMPTAKKSGRTVLGVRMGCQAFNRCWRKALSMSSSLVNLPRLAATEGPAYLGVAGSSASSPLGHCCCSRRRFAGPPFAT